VSFAAVGSTSSAVAASLMIVFAGLNYPPPRYSATCWRYAARRG
jgi:hypothetical protein